MECHQEQYKHKTDSVNEIKERRNQEVVSLRKEKREKLISSKRFRFDESDAGGDQNYSVLQVVELIGKLQHGSQDKLKDLQALRQACAQGIEFIDAFFHATCAQQCSGFAAACPWHSWLSLQRRILLFCQCSAQKYCRGACRLPAEDLCITGIGDTGSAYTGTARHFLFFEHNDERVDNSLQCIVGLLTGSDETLQLEAAWCLTNISAGTGDHALAVANTAAPYLTTFLSSGNPQLQDQCAWALGNLAGDSPECRNILYAQGIALPMVKLIQSPDSSVIMSAAFALSNIVRESPEITREIVQAGILDMLPPYLNSKPENRGILSEVAWILTYVSTTGEHETALLEKGILTSIVIILVKLSTENPIDVQAVTPLLRCLGNICSGPDENSMMAIENPRLMHALEVYLGSDVQHVVKETLWVFSNMAGEHSIAKSIAHSVLLTRIMELLSAGFDVKHEALYVLNNIACQGPDACDWLLAHKVLHQVVPILKADDVELLNLSLGFCELILRHTEAGYNVFEHCEGIARLEALEYHNNTVIAGKAHDILDTYFGPEKPEMEAEEEPYEESAEN